MIYMTFFFFFKFSQTYSIKAKQVGSLVIQTLFFCRR